ncbi:MULTISPECIES: NAD(P)/FAD-dependent oxidoreductase [Streptomyces]|uniref:NAD(P)/FAD-dependent oxidoreductase n=1 Tax=Streptomyces TaxID=1883 RepID=UPI00081EC680|nr:FAD-binding oxidoreductase [Streptomyces sp. PpalLS-921]SCE27245.1 Glycine/D-amino acid oxidase [Streptomyces sp. PpalLS-921]
MSESYDVVVVGGGLLGCLTAWMAARDGARVLLVDKDQVNQHASGQNAGSLHFQLEYRMVEAGEEAARVAAEAMPLHLDAAAMWARLEDEIGESLGVRQTGGLMVAENADQVGMLEFKAELERSWGLDVRTLDRSELDTVAPYLSRDIVAANLSALEGKADARIAAPAVARAAVAAGAAVCARTRLTGARHTPTGWDVTLRETDRTGEVRTRTVRTAAVVIAAGVWTTELGQVFGAGLPTVPLALTMTVTSKVPAFIPHLVQHAGARLSLKQSLDKTVLIGGGWPARLMRDADGAPEFDRKHQLVPRSIAGNARAAVNAVPSLERVPAVRSWVGTTTVAPDQLPLVGAVKGAPGVFVATGGSAFTLGPSFARVLTGLLAGRSPDIDLAPYDPARFTEGSTP